ncbi:MAG: PEGA domain-containing protein [Planctomycetes bacterium]|jgi:hypothetical protein|nr:PEGA domain-containing protein [Phycisphaerae bacterium]NBB94903.1 PEGA domain-containing protein [Planctomycetota bacterium]
MQATQRTYRGIAWLTLALALAAATGCTNEQVTVRTDPPGAKVYWDNVYVGDSPVTFAPPLNREAIFEEVHIVEVVKKGYMTGLGYVAERGGGAGLMTSRVDIVMHEAPDWYVSQEPAAASDVAPAVTPPDIAAAEQQGLSVEEAVDAVDRIACDIRIIRVTDGRVVATAYGLVGTERLIILAEQIAEQISTRMPPDAHGSAVMLRLRNRRRTPAGDQLADELTEMLFRELVYAGPLKITRTIDLRSLVEARMRDHSAVLKNPDVQRMLAGVQYVIQGGIAESRDPRRRDVIVDYNREDGQDE